MPRLVAALLRHADYRQLPDTPSAHQPFPLTDKGRQQAQQAISGLRDTAQAHGWAIDRELQSSCLLRAWETARIIADGLDGDYTISTHADLAERSMGSAANLSIAEIEAVVSEDPRFDSLPGDWKSNSHFCLPLQGAESLMQSGERVAAHLRVAMQQLEARAVEDSVKLFVGHGAAIRHAVHVLGVLEFDEIARLSMYHAQPVFIEYRQKRWIHVAGDWKVRASSVELD